MAFDRLNDNLHTISEKFQDYTTSTVEYYKLHFFKSSMKGAISLVNLLVFGSFFLFVLLFISIGVALYLGIVMESSFAGFLIVGGFYGLVTLFLVIFGKKLIERSLLKKFSALLYDDDYAKKNAKEQAHEDAEEFIDTVENESV
ncbi:phage holin family protein [Marixanthomonas ophiurae]|uniref:Phage holin family protein n=1 Tax=Marixanthomonas ophiurae TaxID=387659 RepID=A0A3E1QAM0_9FLAO|nr:phage holin family protein [Marixanthomonas ophiurae]RFN59189.1 phage holin family protein [Marixanthomonas ophiurae]